MKELSIEEKAKAYDEAIERAKKAQQYDDCNVVPYIFPKLKEESEDERIREAIIKIINRYAYNSNTLKPKMLAWLEKQGEQKPAHEIEPTPIFRIGDILKRKGKDYTFRVDRIQGGYYHCDRNNGAFFPIEEQGNWGLIEQEPAWSEEDETTINNLVWAISNDCIRPQDREDYCDWLKSLRPQNRWKPSDEQMNALEAMLTVSPQSPAMTSALIELYEDLKKLKG